MDDDFTRSVSDAFRRAEPAGAPEADWDDLSGRIEGRHRRQRNILGGCAVVVALATGLGGYALGNNGGGTLTVKSDSPSTAAGSGGSSRSNGSGSDAAPSPLIATAPGTITFGDTSGGNVNSTKLISRRTAAGLEIRSWRSTFPPGTMGTQENVPDECVATGNVTFAVISDDDLVQNGVSETAATRPIVTLSSQSGSLGTDPVLTVTVTAVDEASVSATFPDGTVDSMSPVDHTVILAAAASVDDVRNWSRTKIQFTSADGTTRDVTPDAVNAMVVTDLAANSPVDPSTPALPQIDCTPRLPAPGEQPADAAAAHDAVVSAFTRLYDPNVPDDEKIGLVDDPTGVRAGWDAARTGSFAEAAKNSEFKLVDLVFTSPTEASIKYDILLPTGSTPVGSLTGQMGKARFVDGSWRVTHDTICGVLSMAGAGCGGDSAGTSSSGSSGPTVFHTLSGEGLTTVGPATSSPPAPAK